MGNQPIIHYFLKFTKRYSKKKKIDFGSFKVARSLVNICKKQCAKSYHLKLL